jgi:heterodisulfide reductase subunit A-like polyferredoxin
LGGMEYAEDIVTAMDLEQMEQSDPSLGKLLKDLRSVFKQWSKA